MASKIVKMDNALKPIEEYIYDVDYSELSEIDVSSSDDTVMHNFTEEDILYICVFVFEHVYDDCVLMIMQDKYREKWNAIIQNALYDKDLFKDSIFTFDEIEQCLVEIQESIIQLLESHIVQRSIQHHKEPIHSENVSYILNKIHIKNEHLPEQRTDGWYTMRHNMISASSLWKCLQTESTLNQIIKEKTTPYKSFGPASMNSPLHWGQKYEPVAQMYYENCYNTEINEYGCIQHDVYKFIGASPDGINIKQGHYLYGRMLEIKCVVNRVITGIPKKEYWVQMQTQMECCDLDACDFLECQFKEYETQHEFVNDVGMHYMQTKDGKKKGIFLCFLDEKQIPFYVYPPISFTRQKEFENWESIQMEKYTNYTWVKNVYWYLNFVSCVTVERNRDWFNSIIPKIREVWTKIEKTRKNMQIDNLNSTITTHDEEIKKVQIKSKIPQPKQNMCIVVDV